jgi:thiamine-monophosphate kinase
MSDIASPGGAGFRLQRRLQPPKFSEIKLVEWLQKLAPPAPGLILGIGHDCAVFRPKPGEDVLLKSDQLIEGVHFRSDLAPAAVGERALARALSDIAAAGGEPRVCLVSLTVSKQTSPEWIKAFFQGLLRLAKRTCTGLAGGDLARADRIYCDVMICGAVPKGKALRRDGARPGDSLWVSGRLGKSWDRRIKPRLDLAPQLRGRATACMDISDGLALDLHRLTKASGVAAEIDRIPLAAGATIDRALHGGEDYELLFTLPSRLSGPRGTTRIGTIVRGNAGEVRFKGNPVEPRGYDHFS